MKKITLGLIAGTILGLLDGLSAIFIPEAADMLQLIIISATIKGLITGVIIGLIARKVDSVGMNVLYGGIVSALLSLLSAIPSGAYMEIIAPGIVIGLLIGFIASRWGK